MHRSAILILGGSLFALAIMVWLLATGGDASRDGMRASDSQPPPILLFCAASNEAVIEAIQADFEVELQRQVAIQYGPSQTLLSSLEVSGTGDLYLPADDSFLKIAQEKGLVEEVLPIARMRGVAVVKKGNPKGIASFADLLSDDIRFVQANPDTAAIAKLTRETLTEQGLWADLDDATAAYRTTVTDVANDVLVGAADAGIVYDAVLHSYDDLEFVELAELRPIDSQVSVGVLKSSQRPPLALQFARYLSARDRGLKRYAEYGFRPGKGDKWSLQPELTVFAGSMLRPAIESTIAAFEKREGIRVSRIYNGCGILVTQMQAGQSPDVFFASDSGFMKQVDALFAEPVNVSQNELVILVPKGNPKGIGSLQDLTLRGLRVGIGHENQCAAGWLTQKVFDESGLCSEIMPNVTMQTATGDILVNQLRTGLLDAVVVYMSNAAGSAEYVDAVRIQGLPCSVATQPWAISNESDFPALAHRLFAQICSTESQEAFAAQGFRWQLATKDKHKAP